MKLRKATIEKLNGFLKTAQEEEPEEIEEEPEVEEPEVEEPKEEGLENRLEKLEETLEVVIDGLESHKEILEQVVSGDVESEEDFVEFVEEQEDVDLEELTKEEFGLEDENLVTAEQEENMTLRQKRRARLSKRGFRTKAETLKDQWDEPKSTKKTFKPISPEVPKGKPATDKTPDMLKIADLSLEQTPDKLAWMVLGKDDKHLYTIHQGELSAEDFGSAEFAKQVIRDMQKLGVEEALKKYDAEKPEKKKEKEKEEKACVDKKMAKTYAADFRRRFMRAFRLALTAMNKNLVKPVPLKLALFDVMDSLDIPEPEKIIEAAFARAANDHFEVALAQVDKYMGMTDEAFIEAESMIGDTETAEVVIKEASTMPSRANEIKRKARDGSLPFSTASSEDLGDNITKLENVLPRPKLASMFGK